MRKMIIFLLTAFLLAGSVTAGAEYQQYRLVTGDATYAFNWQVYALDAHNTVVTAWTENNKPWHVTWYRDGEKFRDLTWFVDEPYLEYSVVPEPVLWDGEHLTVVYSARKGAFKSIIKDGMVCPDPDNYDTHVAEWTENGLEDTDSLQENWYSLEQFGRIMIHYGEDGCRIRNGGEEMSLPESFRILPEERVVSLRCYPYGEDSCLLSYLDYQDAFKDRHTHVICTDHGKERYNVTLSDDDEWDIMPDGKGGFLVRNGWSEGDYQPVKLTHYNADGAADRKLELKGDKVVIRVGPSVIDENGCFVMYGTAMASSRKVYTVFRMTIDDEMHVQNLDIRKIDPVYDAYGAGIYTAQDRTAYVMIYKTDNTNGRLRPVLIPFDLLEKSEDDHSLTLQ